jgi:hypothetical protein
MGLKIKEWPLGFTKLESPVTGQGVAEQGTCEWLLECES